MAAVEVAGVEGELLATRTLDSRTMLVAVEAVEVEATPQAPGQPVVKPRTSSIIKLAQPGQARRMALQPRSLLERTSATATPEETEAKRATAAEAPATLALKVRAIARTGAATVALADSAAPRVPAGLLLATTPTRL